MPPFFSAAGFTESEIANDPFHFILRAESIGNFVAQLVLPFGLVGELGYRLLRPLILLPLRHSMTAFAGWVSTRGTPAAASPGTPVRR